MSASYICGIFNFASNPSGTNSLSGTWLAGCKISPSIVPSSFKINDCKSSLKEASLPHKFESLSKTNELPSNTISVWLPIPPQ